MRSCMNECTHACARAGGYPESKQDRCTQVCARTCRPAGRRSPPSPCQHGRQQKVTRRGSQESARGRGNADRTQAGEGVVGGKGQGALPGRRASIPSFIPECMHSALVRSISFARQAGFRRASFLSCMNERMRDRSVSALRSGIALRHSLMLEQLTKFQSSSRALACIHAGTFRIHQFVTPAGLNEPRRRSSHAQATGRNAFIHA